MWRAVALAALLASPAAARVGALDDEERLIGWKGETHRCVLARTCGLHRPLTQLCSQRRRASAARDRCRRGGVCHAAQRRAHAARRLRHGWAWEAHGRGGARCAGCRLPAAGQRAGSRVVPRRPGRGGAGCDGAAARGRFRDDENTPAALGLRADGGAGGAQPARAAHGPRGPAAVALPLLLGRLVRRRGACWHVA